MVDEIEKQELQPTPVRIVETAVPVPVKIETAEPVPVKVVEERHVPPPPTVEKSSGLVATPTSTEEQDRHTASQRLINRKWENVQAIIAVSVTSTACLVSMALIYFREYALGVGLISSMVFLIIGFYFGRTNHEKVGGVGGSNYSGR